MRISSLYRVQKEQFRILKVKDLDLVVEQIYIFVRVQIQATAVTHASVTVTTTKNTREKTKVLGRDSMVVQQEMHSSKYESGRSGKWYGHEAMEK
jgi:hypothetical protein